MGPDKGGSEPQRALFVCEDAPLDGLAGANAYNRAVLDALVDSGVTVDVLVTSPRLQLLPAKFSTPPGVRRWDFVHARRVGDRTVPTTPRSLARVAKSRLSRGRRRPTPNDRRAIIGRVLTDQELRAVRRIVAGRHYDLLAIDTAYRGPVLDCVAHTRSLLVAHDVFAARERSFVENGFEVHNPLSPDAERAVWRDVDLVAAISPADAEVIGSETDARTVALLPVVTSKPASAGRGPARRATSAALFIGAAAYHNVDGLGWLLREVWPEVRARVPDAELHVVGTVGDAVETAPEGVNIHGRVADLGVIAERCRFAVNPLRMGSGLKIKMVDYFDLGLPCISTAVGAEGFPLDEASPFVVVSTSDAMVGQMAVWLTEPERLVAHRDGIEEYLSRFSREAARNSMLQLLTSSAHHGD